MMQKLPAVYDISAWGGLGGLTIAGAFEAGKESTKSKTEEVQHTYMKYTAKQTYMCSIPVNA